MLRLIWKLELLNDLTSFQASSMKVYFIRRLLLVPLTMIGVTFLGFSITRIMPGGPIEQQMQEAAKASMDGGGGAGKGGGSLTDEQLEELEREYGYDKILPIAYLQWLGALPRERRHSQEDFKKGGEERVGDAAVEHYETETLVIVGDSGRQAKVVRAQGELKRPMKPKDEEDQEASEKFKSELADWKEAMKKSLAERHEVVSATYLDDNTKVSKSGWKVRIETPEDLQATWLRRHEGKKIEDARDNYDARAVMYKTKFSGVIQGDFGRSTEFGEPVLTLIWQRMPIAAYFGLLTALISYGVCLPLGVLKAIKHRTPIDNLSSVLIFVGYSIPGFALGAVLVVYLGARTHMFPLLGLTGPEFDTLSNWGKVKDLAHHTVLPLLCYVVSSFAWLTMMMKNNLMDNLAADYVRTAVAKGVRFRTAVFRHAFRNSFIPIATSLGQLITIFVTGSMLIEAVFDIQGFGLLQLIAITGKDSYVIMGTLVFASFLMIMGNILSDLIVAFVDPRVKFN
ncbi:MAG: ABC transporter permease [Roseibacillus sp.]|nr:ABC transporter permease [Roseibacillus sp.]